MESRNINKKGRNLFLIPFPKKFKNPEARGLKTLKKYLLSSKDTQFLEQRISNQLKLTLTGKSTVYELARQKHKQATAVKYLRYRR